MEEYKKLRKEILILEKKNYIRKELKDDKIVDRIRKMIEEATK